MAAIVREAVHAYVSRTPRQPPPGAGAFASGVADTADHADDVLEAAGFGRSSSRRGRRIGAAKKTR